ncbi:MAG TPA: hypothetical protein VN625_05610 [Desulfuromonadaceae bacterium]|nr:hypothetical protein [Desulfuromonadaceae bacterium]
MKNFFYLLLVCLGCRVASAQETFPAIRLVPEDIVQDSVKQVRWTTNHFAVKWTYTEVGAKKLLAFWGRHEGQKVCIQAGSFTCPPFVAPASLDPVTHTDWRNDWFKRRTDKFMNVSEDDAKAIVAGLTGK